MVPLRVFRSFGTISCPQTHACTSVAIPPGRTPRSCVFRSTRCTSIAFHPSSASIGFLPSLFPCMHARRGRVHLAMGSCAIERIDGEPGTIRVWVEWEPPLSTLVSAPFSSALVSLVFRRNRTFPIRVRGRGGKGNVLGNVFLFVGCKAHETHAFARGAPCRSRLPRGRTHRSRTCRSSSTGPVDEASQRIRSGSNLHLADGTRRADRTNHRRCDR